VRARATLSALSAGGRVRRVLVAYALFGFVEFFVWMVVILWAFARGGATLAGIAAIVQLVPAALLAPAVAGVGDRIPRGTALALAHAFVAVSCLATAAALAAGAPPPVVILASTLVTTAVATVRPIHFAALPQLAWRPEVLVSANAVSSFADGVTRFVGAVVAALLSEAWGFAPSFLVAAGCATAAGLLCLRLGLSTAGHDTDDTDDDTGSLRVALQGLAVLARDWGALSLLVVLTIDFVLTGALDVLGVSFTTDVLGRPAAQAGFVVGAMGVGALVGAVAATAVGHRRRLSPVVVASGVLEGAAFAAVAAVTVLVPVLLLLIVSGLSGAIMMVSGRTLLQRATDDRVLARVFAVQESTTLVGTAFGAVLAPVLLNLLGPRNAFLPLGIGCALLAVTGVVLMRRLDERARLHPRELALLDGIPFLGVLPIYELERLAQHARWETRSAGAVVIRQGDVGDAFYVVERGELAVAVDGVATGRPIRAGDGFGEIALLHAVSRTATVTAATDVRLLVLDSGDFLAAVTGHADGHAIAAETSAAHLARDRMIRLASSELPSQHN
jgi:predicted MFS family arabinose efflux permease